MSPATVVPVNPVYLNNSTLVIAEKDYAMAASKIECIPSTSTATFQGMKPGASYSATSVDSWALTVDFAQDYETATSFSNLLFDSSGETVEVQFAPIDGGQAWEADVVLVPGGIGGAGKSHATSSVTLGVQGEPRRVVTIP